MIPHAIIANTIARENNWIFSRGISMRLDSNPGIPASPTHSYEGVGVRNENAFLLHRYMKGGTRRTAKIPPINPKKCPENPTVFDLQQDAKRARMKSIRRRDQEKYRRPLMKGA
mmetsp:Transcript_17708/g.26522  ORF Transcript_17708/g.26522 Transcript_17708/m.26522 type:complete len:114 (+) Transcript_17708:756-1097(+)